MRLTVLVLVVAALALTQVPARSAPPDSQAADADTASLAQLSPEQLFLRASSSALQFEHMLAPSRRMLVRDYERSLPYLISRLDTDDPRERIALEDLLVKIGDPSVEPLIDAMAQELERDDTSRGARLASSIMGRLGDERAIPSLVPATTHADWKVRSSAVAALGRIGSSSPVEAVAHLLDDPNEVVRSAACVALKRIADAENGTLGEAAMARLADSLDDSNYAVRYSAASALTACRGHAAGRLETLALHGRGHSQLLAIRALGGVGSRRALDALRSFADSGSWLIRGEAALALGNASAAARDRRVLERMALDPHPFVASCARQALGRIGGPQR